MTAFLASLRRKAIHDVRLLLRARRPDGIRCPVAVDGDRVCGHVFTVCNLWLVEA